MILGRESRLYKWSSMRKEQTMSQKEKSETTGRPATKPGIKAPVKVTRVATAKRLAVNHNETLLRSAIASQR